MTEIEPVQDKPKTIQQLLKADNTQKAFQEVLGGRSAQYITSIVTMVNNASALRKCEPISLVNACIIAATLDLPISPTLGYAYIIPYGNKAQFQIGYKGLVQLALRTKMYERLGAREVYEGQLVKYDEFGEPEFDFNAQTGKEILGYMAYFKLKEGYKKTFWMTKEEVEKHADKFSQTYRSGKGVWKDNFNAMSKKTVLKMLLLNYAPLSTQMQQAIEDDQKVDDEYADNNYDFEVEDITIEGEIVDDLEGES